MKRIKIKKKVFLTFLILIFLSASVFSVTAAEVTDTLTIKVGYWGMDKSTYVEKCTYHWTELDEDFNGGAIENHNADYSFYREPENHEYQVIVDSARGVYIDELMAYSGISLRDIKCIYFYTKDKEVGEFTSFTYAELFETQRYYYENLSSYLSPVYNRNKTKITDVALDDDVESSRKVVKPMLALSDSWNSFDYSRDSSSGIEDYSSLSASNRFRLLFGQTSPMESRTNQTAKYVHTLYVALEGVPEVTKSDVLLSDKVGSHSITFNVAAKDEKMIQSLIDEMKWSSSDETVLKIKNIKMVGSGKYDDAVEVTIDYDILKQGKAYLNGDYLGIEIGGEIISTYSEEEPQDESGNDEDEDGDEITGTSGDSGSEKKEGSSKGDKNKSENKSEGKVSYVLSDEIAALLAKADEKEYDEVEVEEEKDEPSAMYGFLAGTVFLFLTGSLAGFIDFRRRL